MTEDLISVVEWLDCSMSVAIIKAAEDDELFRALNVLEHWAALVRAERAARAEKGA